MSASILYCLDDAGNGYPCVKVYEGGVEILHSKLEYPYEDVPTVSITQLVEDAKVLFNQHLTETSAAVATEAEVNPHVWHLSFVGKQLTELLTIRNSRPDYTP